MPAGSPYARASNLFQVKGFLVQHLDGFSLSDMRHHAPESQWTPVLRDTMRKILLLDEHNIIDEHIHSDDVVVVWKDRSTTPEGGDLFLVFLANFDGYEHRREDEGDMEWLYRKQMAAEDARVG
ncbi:unnamed protein product [Discula destructiva]